MSLIEIRYLLLSNLDKNNQETTEYSAGKTNKLSKESIVYPKTNSQMKRQQTDQRKFTLPCGCPGPHEYFLGVDHYLNNTDKRPSSNLSNALVTSNDKQQQLLHEEERDDDDDIISQ